METRPVKIAIIGAGVIGPRHAEAIQKTQSATLVCFVDPSPQASKVAKRFDVALYTSISSLLSTGHEIDAAVICTPSHTHVSVSLELLNAGIHLLIEKPLCTTPESGFELIKHAQSLGLHILVGHHRRFNPYITATQQALRSGAIGTPIAILGLWTSYKPASYFSAPTCWHASAAEGGGPVAINLVHDIDLLQYLFGPITSVSAAATMKQRPHGSVEEGAAILLRFGSGVVGTFVLCDATPSGHSFEAGTGENPAIPRTGLDFYRIFGSEGCLSVPEMTVSGYAAGEEKDWSREMVLRRVEVEEGTVVPFERQMEHFVRVVRGAERPRCTGLEALRAVVVCEAVKKAISTGQTEVVGLLEH